MERRSISTRSVDTRVRVVRSEKNIGQNGYARGFAMTSAKYLVELDDDVVDAPLEWDAMLLDAYRRLPDVGFLAADLEDDPHDIAADYRYRIRPHEYVSVHENGVRLLKGPTGGGCAMTARDLYDRVGGFRQDERHLPERPLTSTPLVNSVTSPRSWPT